MKKISVIVLTITAAVLAGFLAVPAVAQDEKGLPAKAALINIANKFGADKVQWIAELRGYYGQPQPEEWEIVLYDAESRYRLNEYWAGEGNEVTDEGHDNDFYPKRSPAGFVRLKDLNLDSKAAFTIAENQARLAKVGFNAVNYFLRAREYSREPIWTLELLDISDNIAGKIYVSGANGEVLRTVWFFRGDRGRSDGRSLIVDSAAPREGEDSGRGMRPGPSSSPGETENLLIPSDDPAASPPPSSSGPIPKPPVPSGPGEFDTKIPPPPVPPAAPATQN